jgi:hypothetical protein
MGYWRIYPKLRGNGDDTMGMVRYVSIFLLTLLITIVLGFTMPLILMIIFGPGEYLVVTLLSLFACFIITQLFYIIELLKKRVE